MSIAALFTFIGGIGLFLLGMRLMTDGLKVAAGDTLRNILGSATRSRGRAVASGVLITAVVQSSSAVIFATIGFVNAGLLKLTQAVGIIYGSNLGTTLTSWIVAILGFNVNLQAVAMPAIGIGMALWVAFGSRRYGALGHAFAGLGLFFLGIDVLKTAFSGIDDGLPMQAWADYRSLGLLIFVAVGIVLTVLMQSSSAALAVTLTAAATGVIPLNAAAAMVIGANVGTTSTAAFAVIGATAAAKRAATAHVIFNIITAIAAFALLPVMLWLVDNVATLLGLNHQPATLLAIFHTMTKLAGIAIMWPLTDWLVRLLERMYRTTEEDERRLKFLDHNIQGTPSLAMDALAMELHRMALMARDLACQAISSEQDEREHLTRGSDTLEELNLAVGEFASGIARNGSASSVASVLPDALRVGQYLANVAEAAVDMNTLHKQTELSLPELVAMRDTLRAHAVDLLQHSHSDTAQWTPEVLQASRADFEQEYQAYKSRLLHAGTAGNLPPRRMALSLEQMSALHRIVDQMTKSSLYLQRFIEQTHTSHDQAVSADPPDDTDKTQESATPQEQEAEVGER